MDLAPRIRSAHRGGTPVTPVISCRRKALSRSPGNLERSRYRVAPARREVVNWLIPAAKLRGSDESIRSSGVFSRCVGTIWAHPTTVRWVVETTFGIPVDPQV